MEDERFMVAALREAKKGIGHTSPNPAVGAVIVSGGKIIARGWHRCAGMPHAEVEALQKIRNASGATLYVTLEPCSTRGRTPPCVEAIIRAGISRVVVGTVDPNPVHAGRGLTILRKRGIKVDTDILEKECRDLNKSFNKWIVTGIPFVIAKAGMSLDGRLSRPPDEGRWITSEKSRAHAHQLRARVDAILIGAETLRQDNPLLTVRGIRGAKQPFRVVLTRTGNLPGHAHLFTDEHREKTLVYKNKSLCTVMRDLGRRQITSVLIEGGGNILGQAFDRHLVDEAHFYIAPLLICGSAVSIGGRGVGSSSEAPRIKNPTYEKIGGDIHAFGEVEY